MPQKAYTKSEVIPPSGASPRALVFNMTSTRNKPEWPRKQVPGPLYLERYDATACQGWETDDGADISPDAPNISSAYELATGGFDQRLYATAYAAFADQARNGSGEWGMNALSWRKSLGTLYSLATTSAVVVGSLAKVHKNAWEYLRKKPDTSEQKLRGRRRWLAEKRAKSAKDRIRLNNEIYLLEQVSGLLLAYRYALSPLMSDIAQTAELLSSPSPDGDNTISHRVAKKRTTPFRWDYGPPFQTWQERGVFTESVVLKCTTTVSNPNLHLATQLGLTNPLYWIWDSIPWSFMADWWFNVSGFVNSFSATLGLSLSSESVTQTRTYEGTYAIQREFPQKYVFRGRVAHKLKRRSTGSLPWPSAIPYGNGLGLQRAQNALALIGQFFSKRIH